MTPLNALKYVSYTPIPITKKKKKKKITKDNFKI